MKRLLSFLLTLTLSASFIQASAFEIPLPQPAYLLVGNKGDNTISFIDLETGREIARRPVSGNAPHEIAITPSGEYAAVVNYGDASVDIFHTGYKTRLAPINLGENRNPHGIVALRNGDFIATTEGGNSIVRLSREIISPAEVTLSPPDIKWIVSSIPTGQDGTHMVAVSPDERFAYTANMQSGTVSRIDLKTEQVISAPAGKEVEGVAVTKDGSEVWA
jgi:DNA-binding beta-propeller fold protein YncE